MSHPNRALAESNAPHATNTELPPLYAAPASRRRPGSVTAAAVLAFVYGGLGTLVYLFILLRLAALTASYHLTTHLFAVVVVITLLEAAFTALFIWGGVRALKGRKTMLLVMSVMKVGLTALALVRNLADGTTSPGTALVQAVLGLVFAVPILVLLAQRPSAEFFRARRGATT